MVDLVELTTRNEETLKFSGVNQQKVEIEATEIAEIAEIADTSGLNGLKPMKMWLVE